MWHLLCHLARYTGTGAAAEQDNLAFVNAKLPVVSTAPATLYDKLEMSLLLGDVS